MEKQGKQLITDGEVVIMEHGTNKEHSMEHVSTVIVISYVNCSIVPYKYIDR